MTDDLMVQRKDVRDRTAQMYVQFAALEQLLAEGRIKKVRGGYQFADGAAYAQVSLLVAGGTFSANGQTATLKLMKRTKSFDESARKLGVDVPSE